MAESILPPTESSPMEALSTACYDHGGEVVPFPVHRTRTDPADMQAGDWYIAKGPGAGAAGWITWVACGAPVDHGGSVGLAVKAFPLVAPDGSWPYGEAVSREEQWRPLSEVVTFCPMPSAPVQEVDRGA